MSKRIVGSQSYLRFDQKIEQFAEAIKNYRGKKRYIIFERFISIFNISLQCVSSLNCYLSWHELNYASLFITLIFAYIVTDFLNGFVHMVMDNNMDYTSPAGPFVASFHLHHIKIKYQDRHPLIVYFYESGTKFWLAVYLLVWVCIQTNSHVPLLLNIGFTMFGILSSCAEVSHYWCHNSGRENKIIFFLQKNYILLNKKHHAHHHLKDNTHYAFLNGMSDILLNKIANYWYGGYKNHSDKHAQAFANFELNNGH